MIDTILTLSKKEFKQIYRDKRTMYTLIFIPSFMLVMFGYALNFDIKHVPMAVYDMDRSQDSRSFIDNFINTEYFTLHSYVNSGMEIDKLMNREKIKLGIVIPSGFADKLLSRQAPVIQVIVDGSNSNSASTVVGYTNNIIQQYSINIMVQSLMKIGKTKITLPIDFRPRVWYNPELKSTRFLIPGLIGFILLIITVITTSLSIVREKERNTIEQIIVSPISPFELIAGKTLPYIFISLIASILVMLASYILFGIYIKGSYILLFIITLIFLTGTLGMGILISTIAETQQVAFLLSVLSTLLPAFLLSGFVFPIRNMPVAIQVITYVLPVRYYLVVLRNIILKGSGLYAYWDQVLFLIGFAVLMLGVSSIRLAKSLNKK